MKKFLAYLCDKKHSDSLEDSKNEHNKTNNSLFELLLNLAYSLKINIEVY